MNGMHVAALSADWTSRANDSANKARGANDTSNLFLRPLALLAERNRNYAVVTLCVPRKKQNLFAAVPALPAKLIGGESALTANLVTTFARRALRAVAM